MIRNFMKRPDRQLDCRLSQKLLAYWSSFHLDAWEGRQNFQGAEDLFFKFLDMWMHSAYISWHHHKNMGGISRTLDWGEKYFKYYNHSPNKLCMSVLKWPVLTDESKARWNAEFIRTLYSSNRNNWPQYCNKIERRDVIFILGLSILLDRTWHFATTGHHYIWKTNLSKHESHIQCYTPDVVFHVRKRTLLFCSTVPYRICQMRNISPNT